MVRIGVTVVVLLLFADAALSFANTTLRELEESELMKDTRRRRGRKKKSQSTSSSSRDKGSSSTDDKETLELSSDTESSSEDSKHPKPKSSLERTGWRKWHRKCASCPSDMKKKWRDPSIKWICGAYQQARRSFKSLCMMHYRNCQDGTMFIKIDDRRCPNSTGREQPKRGDHFFYDYKAKLYDDSSNSKTETSSDTSDSSTSFD